MLCAIPSSIRQTIAADRLLISAKTSSIAYHVTVAPISRRAARMPLATLRVIDPISEPKAKLADR
jgi:hypothetical protein